MEGSNNARSRWLRKRRKRDATFFRMLEYSLLLRKPNRPDVPVSEPAGDVPCCQKPSSQQCPGVLIRWVVLAEGYTHPLSLAGRKPGLASCTDISRKGQMLVHSETPEPASLCAEGSLTQGHGPRQMLCPRTANMWVSVYDAWLNGETKTERKIHRRCFLGRRARPMQTEIKHGLFLVW